MITQWFYPLMKVPDNIF